MKKSIKDLGDVRGKRALVRVDINVPLDADKNVTDDTRIQAILPTVNFLKEKGVKIILMAHLGRPQKLKEGQKLEDLSLAPVAKYMSKVLGEEVKFVKSPVGEGADKELADLKDGQVALLENIRYYKAEEAKDDDMTFAEELAKLGIRAAVMENEIVVEPGHLLKGQTLSGHNDHRIVMALAFLLSIAGGSITEAESVKKSLPDFFTRIQKLGIGVTSDELDK